jgi:hypothetical protein
MGFNTYTGIHPDLGTLIHIMHQFNLGTPVIALTREEVMVMTMTMK